MAWKVGTWASLAMIAHMMTAPHGRPAEFAREDASQWVVSLLAVVAAGAAIAAIVWELGPMKGMNGATGDRRLALVAATIVSAWTFIHLIFALHYAGSYYAHDESGGIRRGLQFSGDGEAGWTEFLYQAFVIGCACATADVNVTTTHMRRIVVTHGVVAFVFNTGILALTINIASGLL
jgi:uncharacterized membrane protein